MQIQVFQYEGGNEFSSVRTVIIDGEVWFVASDVCMVLGYKKPNNAIRTHCKEKGTLKQGIPTKGGRQEVVLINEPNVYRLILKSRLPKAELFEEWLLGEVLPAIRKTGGYGQARTPIFVRRFNDNWNRVSKGHFSVISELFVRLYGKFEQAGYSIPDKAFDGREIRPDVSVGRGFSNYLKRKHPDIATNFSYYRHVFPNKFECDARQYPNSILHLFIEYVEDEWIPQKAEIYFRDRDTKALEYIPKLLPAPSNES